MIKKTDLSTQVVLGVSKLELSLAKCNTEVNNTIHIRDTDNGQIVDLIFFDSESVGLIIDKLTLVKKLIKKEEKRVVRIKSKEGSI